MTIVKGSDVIGLNVVTIEDGRIIETVDDIAYNPSSQRVEALLVSSGGLFSSAKAIHMDDVRNIGSDAVIVPNDSVMKSVKQQDDSVRSISDSNKFLVKTNILTVDGLELGKVTDIFFDSATGMVQSMEVSQGGLKKLSEGKKSITPADIVTIGADATVVSAYTEAKLEAQGEQGGVKGMVNDIKSNVESTAESVRESSKEMAEKTAAKTEELKAAATERMADLKDSTSENSARLKHDADQKIEDAKRAIQGVSEDAKSTAAEMTERVSRAADDFKEKSSTKKDESVQMAEEVKAEAKSSADKLAATIDRKASSSKQKLHEGKEVVKKESVRGK